jgi:hypothetical protein
MRWGEDRQSHCRSGLLKLLVNSSHSAWCRLISNTSSIICGEGGCNMRLVQREAATARCCRRHSARSQNRASNATSLTISSATTAAACAALLAPCARSGSTAQWTSPIASATCRRQGRAWDTAQRALRRLASRHWAHIGRTPLCRCGYKCEGDAARLFAIPL